MRCLRSATGALSRKEFSYLRAARSHDARRRQRCLPSDAGAIASLLAELGFPASPRFAAERVGFFDAEPSSRVQVAEVDGEVVGLVATHVVPRLDTELLSCRVVDLVVAEDQRGSGIGRGLVRAAEAEARRRGCRRLDLSSAEPWAEAHSFYDAVGFERRSQGFVKRLERVGS